MNTVYSRLQHLLLERAHVLVVRETTVLLEKNLAERRREPANSTYISTLLFGGEKVLSLQDKASWPFWASL